MKTDSRGSFRIGTLAELTGTPTPTIRYYEEIGLLPPAERRPGGQRVYDQGDVRRLSLIRRGREFGFSIEQVRALVQLLDDRDASCTEVRDVAATHLSAVRVKLAELEELARSLASFVDDCDRRCAGGPGSDCVILEDLGRNLPSQDSGCRSSR